MQAPALSCCVVAWSAAERLPRLLRSLAAERAAGLDLEVIVTDNASPDGTAALVARDWPWVTLLASATNLGYAGGQALALARAQGGAVLCLNDDLEVPPGALGALLAELAAHPDAVAVGPALVNPDGSRQRSAGPLPGAGAALHRLRWLRWTGLFRGAHARFRQGELPPGGPVPCLMGAALLARRDALARVGWDEGFPFGLEDADLCARLGALGALRYAPAVTVRHAGGVASRANPRRVVAGYERGWVRYVAKHDPRPWLGELLALGTVLDLPLRAGLLAGRALVLGARGRGGDGRAALGQAAATAGFALGGWPALLREGWPRAGRPGARAARLALGLGALAVWLGAAAGSWPALRTVAPQLAVDAAAQAALVTSPRQHPDAPGDDPPVLDDGTLDPWGGRFGEDWRPYDSNINVLYVVAPGPDGAPGTPDDLLAGWERIGEPWVAAVALGPQLLLLVGALLLAWAWLALLRPLPVGREALHLAAAAAGPLLLLACCARYLDAHRWLLPEPRAWFSLPRLLGTCALALVLPLLALRVRARAPG